MSMTPEGYIERLLEISKKKYKLVEDILALTKEQKNSINIDGVDQLSKIIFDKQEKIDDINKLDENFNVYFLSLKKSLKIKSLEEIKGKDVIGAIELQECIKDIMKLIGEIRELEQQNNLKAKNLLDELGREIRKVKQGKKVTNAYNPGYSLIPPSYYIDKKK